MPLAHTIRGGLAGILSTIEDECDDTGANRVSGNFEREALSALLRHSVREMRSHNDAGVLAAMTTVASLLQFSYSIGVRSVQGRSAAGISQSGATTAHLRACA